MVILLKILLPGTSIVFVDVGGNKFGLELWKCALSLHFMLPFTFP